MLVCAYFSFALFVQTFLLFVHTSCLPFMVCNFHSTNYVFCILSWFCIMVCSILLLPTTFNHHFCSSFFNTTSSLTGKCPTSTASTVGSQTLLPYLVFILLISRIVYVCHHHLLLTITDAVFSLFFGDLLSSPTFSPSPHCRKVSGGSSFTRHCQSNCSDRHGCYFPM